LIDQDISLHDSPAMQFKNCNSLETNVGQANMYGQGQLLKEMQQLRKNYSNLLAHCTNLCDAQKIMANDVTQIVYSSFPSPASPSFSSKKRRPTEETSSSKQPKKKATSSVNDNISTAKLQTDAAESASSITLSSLLLIATEKVHSLQKNIS
jgi:hypothetical protein